MQYTPLKNEFDISITLDQILKFIYSNNQLEIDSKKRTSYIDLGEWFEFKSKLELDLFKTFLNLYLESAIDLKIDWIWNDNQIENKELKSELNKYIFEDDRNFLIRKLLKIEKEYDYLEIYDNWEEISKIIKKHDWFNVSIKIRGFEFFDLFFRKITEYKWYDDLNKDEIIDSLFENISNKLNWEINSSKEIEIFYDFDDYLENNRFVFPILKDLEDNKKLNIENVIIKDNYIHFYLDKFIDFKKDIIKDLKPLYERLSFEDWKLKIDDNILISWKKKGTKIYEIIDIIIDWIKKHQKLELSYDELKIIFSENEEKYPYLLNTIDVNWRYSRTKLNSIKTDNERLENIHKLDIDKYLSKVFKLDFFNSSLSKDSKKEYFIIKNKTTGLANLC